MNKNVKVLKFMQKQDVLQMTLDHKAYIKRKLIKWSIICGVLTILGSLFMIIFSQINFTILGLSENWAAAKNSFFTSVNFPLSDAAKAYQALCIIGFIAFMVGIFMTPAIIVYSVRMYSANRDVDAAHGGYELPSQVKKRQYATAYRPGVMPQANYDNKNSSNDLANEKQKLELEKQKLELEKQKLELEKMKQKVQK